MARTQPTQTVHDTLLSRQVNSYNQNGYSAVKADHINHPNGCPPDVYGYTPDLTAVDPNRRLVICEVETADTINSDHTYSQLSAFRRAANEIGGLLHIVVPETSFSYAQQTLRIWGIHADEIWYG